MSSGDDLDDQMIVAEVVSGQKELFRLLVNRHQKKVYGMGLSFFRNADDASDFTQEVFLKVYRNLARFEGRSRFSTWLYAIAYNTGVNNVTRRTEYQSLADQGSDSLAAATDTPEQDAVREAVRTAVLKAVANLPERYRVCVDLFFFYERSYQEIEAITGYPVNTIKSHVFRAKKLLRAQLADLVEGGTA
ncbi:MAG: sigma-70 family RNA polymerase sigma factor [Treponema sp.]|jgi:RNA polymerase sigma-70 factor (ECF subfamily)|nr:sigma-70 family RNA polymerase sigma factor [Treponema sp.]